MPWRDWIAPFNNNCPSKAMAGLNRVIQQQQLTEAMADWISFHSGILRAANMLLIQEQQEKVRKGLYFDAAAEHTHTIIWRRTAWGASSSVPRRTWMADGPNVVPTAVGSQHHSSRGAKVVSSQCFVRTATFNYSCD
jgi:hypothetical protein